MTPSRRFIIQQTSMITTPCRHTPGGGERKRERKTYSQAYILLFYGFSILSLLSNVNPGARIPISSCLPYPPILPSPPFPSRPFPSFPWHFPPLRGSHPGAASTITTLPPRLIHGRGGLIIYTSVVSWLLPSPLPPP